MAAELSLVRAGVCPLAWGLLRSASPLPQLEELLFPVLQSSGEGLELTGYNKCCAGQAVGAEPVWGAWGAQGLCKPAGAAMEEAQGSP